MKREGSLQRGVSLTTWSPSAYSEPATRHSLREARRHGFDHVATSVFTVRYGLPAAILLATAAARGAELATGRVRSARSN